MGTAINHPGPDRVKPSFVILTFGYSDAQGWASECSNVKNYKWRLNPVWHRTLYSCTHVAPVGFKGLRAVRCCLHGGCLTSHFRFKTSHWSNPTSGLSRSSSQLCKSDVKPPYQYQ